MQAGTEITVAELRELLEAPPVVCSEPADVTSDADRVAAVYEILSRSDDDYYTRRGDDGVCDLGDLRAVPIAALLTDDATLPDGGTICLPSPDWRLRVHETAAGLLYDFNSWPGDNECGLALFVRAGLTDLALAETVYANCDCSLSAVRPELAELVELHQERREAQFDEVDAAVAAAAASFGRTPFDYVRARDAAAYAALTPAGRAAVEDAIWNQVLTQWGPAEQARAARLCELAEGLTKITAEYCKDHNGGYWLLWTREVADDLMRDAARAKCLGGMLIEFTTTAPGAPAPLRWRAVLTRAAGDAPARRPLLAARAAER